MRRSTYLCTLTIVLVTAFLLGGVIGAQASVYDTPKPLWVSVSNPNPLLAEDEGAAVRESWWRMGWGTSLYPDFEIQLPADQLPAEGPILGIAYTVDRLEGSIVDTAPGQCYWSYYYGANAGSHLDNTIDLLGVYLDSGMVPPPLGSTGVLEGQWYVHFRYFTSAGLYSSTHTIPFGVDTTAPRAVDDLAVAIGRTSPALADEEWTPATRARISWAPGAYDDLSGVGYYQLWIDDVMAVPNSAANPTQGRTYELPGGFTSSIDIESMPPGRHKISIAPVDRATNEGVRSNVYFCSDPDTPTVRVASPSNGVLSELTPVIVEAHDAACDPLVTISIDSTQVATLTAPPYRFEPDMSVISSGPHVIRVTATDMLGRTATAETTATSLPSGGFVDLGPSSLSVIDKGTSSTNPNLPDDEDLWWRQGWGNSITPDIQLNVPSTDPTAGIVVGQIYTVNRDRAFTMDLSQPGLYWRSSRGASTLFDTTFDLAGILASKPASEWPALSPGAEKAIEGYWYYHFALFTNLGFAAQNELPVRFGVDLTPPRKVTGLSLDQGALSSSGWTANRRATISWDAQTYDDLSGVAYYQVYLDGEPVVPGALGAGVTGRVYELAGRAPSSLTIESMPPGRHSLTLAAVDRATNEGPQSEPVYFQGDPDVPSVAITAPTTTIVGAGAVFSATASDVAGISWVRFVLDDTTLTVVAEAPYTYTGGLAGFGEGTHLLTVVAADEYGREVSATKWLVLDKTSPAITLVSGTPNPFYPRKQDGYKDNFYGKFTVSEPCVAKMTIKNSLGVVVRTITKSVTTGANKITWNGQNSDGVVVAGSYKWTLLCTDAAGNKTATGSRSVAIKFTELVRLSSGAVKVIQR